MSENSGDLSLGYMMGQSENNSGGWGNFGEGLWAVIILAILFGGTGLGGFGGFGGNRGGDNVSAGFAWQGIDNGIRGVQQGLCDGFYAVNTGLLTGFNGVQSQLAACCCDTQRAIERGFCETNANIANQTRYILDYLTNDKIDALRTENQTLRFQASQSAQNAYIAANQEAQTAELIRRLGRDNPVPAYVVPNPNCCYGNPLGVGYAGFGNNNCGCGCGCG